MIKIILDTNFLVYCSKYKIDYEEKISNLIKEGYELVVPSLVVKELGELSIKEKKLSDREAAKLAIKILKSQKIKTMPSGGEDTDKEIINISKSNIVATLDRDIRNKVERAIIIRDGKKIEFG